VWWSDPAGLLRQVFGGPLAEQEVDGGGGGGEEEEGRRDDPFRGLSEGRHRPPAPPPDSLAGFFAGLLGGAEAGSGSGSGAEAGTGEARIEESRDDEQGEPAGLPDFVAAFRRLLGGGGGDDDKSEEAAAPGDGQGEAGGAGRKLSPWEEAVLGGLRASQQAALEESIGVKLGRLRSALREAASQLSRTFSHVPVDRLNLFQVGYAMQREEARKNPVWKRRAHRGLPDLAEAEAVALFDGMYLAYLAYVETCEQVESGLRAFYKDSWVLVNCTTAGQPLRPAHFLAVKRRPTPDPADAAGSASDAGLFPGWPNFLGGGSGRGRQELEVVLAIRGTKELGDALSDALLEPSAYRGGLAHHGIQESAAWIHGAYRGWISHLRRASRSTRVKLWLVGHSLGYVSSLGGLGL
jgi:hypothetical protein